MNGQMTGVEAITFDFGNTLVPVDRESLRRVVEATARDVVRRCGPLGYDDFLAAWHEERERQFAEEVPEGREVDIEQRVVRVFARLRGLAPPPAIERWDDAAAAARSTPDERAFTVQAYSRAFVTEMPVPPDVGPLLARLAERRLLAILSNWPLASTIDAYLEAAGWRASFRAVVVSQRVGAIKPGRAMFDAAEASLGVSGEAILHVGDDWAADVIGAKQAGWRAAYLRDHQGDSPLPTSRPDDAVRADLVLDALADLEVALSDES